jgi:hypothetical protein
MSFSQRFRYNELAQRYAIYSDLWRKKSRIREEGYRRPQDALLSVQGVREEEHQQKHKVYGVSHHGDQPFVVECSDATTDGENVSGSLDSFKSFVQKKTQEIRKQHKCERVEYAVEVQDGKVKLRAKATV